MGNGCHREGEAETAAPKGCHKPPGERGVQLGSGDCQPDGEQHGTGEEIVADL